MEGLLENEVAIDDQRWPPPPLMPNVARALQKMALKITNLV